VDDKVLDDVICALEL